MLHNTRYLVIDTGNTTQYLVFRDLMLTIVDNTQ